jgi:hypothetical protein
MEGVMRKERVIKVDRKGLDRDMIDMINVMKTEHAAQGIELVVLFR